MPGRHEPSGRRSGRRLLAAGALVAAAAMTIGTTLVSGAAAAGAAPKPNYTPGKDKATFTVLGVLDNNCLVSTGGTEIWIKPGDSIDFGSSLVGIDVAGISIGGGLVPLGKVAGLDVTATIYTGNHKQALQVNGGDTTPVAAKDLSAGDHKITWNAKSLRVLGALPVPLTVNALKSGASLSWSGVIHVTKSAPKCRLSVGTPKSKVSVGPVKVTVPPVNVGVPGVPAKTKLPDLGNLVPGTGGDKGNNGGGGNKPSTHSSSSTGPAYTAPGLTIPQQVVPQGGSVGGGGFYNGVLPDSVSQLANSVPGVTGGTSAPSGKGATTQDSTGKHKTIDLASSPSKPSGQLPVLLAIFAIIALALVAGTYARLFLLRQKS